MNIGTLTIEMAANVARLRQDMASATGLVQGAMSKIEGAAGLATKALGAIGVGLSMVALRNFIGGVIETGAALDDLRMQTGATVESLTGMLAIGKFNNVGAEQLGGAMNKLASNMAGATEESKGAGKALEALGINFNEFKGLRPEEQFQTIAQALAGFEDGTGKSAVAMALFGKTGAQMLPFFHDLAEAGELQAKMTTEQAAAAANLDDNLLRLTTSGDGWKKELVAGMVPALDQGAQALLGVMNGSGGLREEVKRLVADGSIKQWTTQAITGLSYVADVAQIAWRVLQSVGKGLGGLAAALVAALQGDFRGAWQALQASGQDMIDAFDGETIGARFRARLSELDAVGAKAEDAKKALDFTNVMEKNGKAAKEAKDPFDALLETVVKATAVYQAEAAAGDKLTEGQKKAIEVLDQVRSGKVKLSESQAMLLGQSLQTMLAAEQENKTREEFLKIAEAEHAARVKIAQAAEQAVTSLTDQNKSLREEIELIGLTERQQLGVLQSRNRALILTKQATLAELERQAALTGTMTREQIALMEEIRLLEERNDLLGQKTDRDESAKLAQETAAAWGNTWQSIDNTAHDVWVNIWDGGSNVFKKLGQVLKASVLDLLYQMVVRKWIIQIGTSVLGDGFGTAAQAATGGSNIFSMASNGSSLLGIGGMATDFMAGFSGATLAPGLMGPTTAGATGMMGLGNMLASIPGWGWALAGLAVLGSMFKDDSGTLHTGGQAQYSKDKGLANSVERGAFGINIGMVRGADTEKAVSDIAKGLVGTLDSMAQAFGRQGGFEVATGYADDTSKDGAWGGLRISRGGKDLLNWDTTQTGDWAAREFANGEEGWKQYLQEIASSTRQVLTEMDLPGWAHDMVGALADNASMEDLSGVVTKINAGAAALASFGDNVVGFAGMSESAVSALVKASGGIETLTAQMASYYQNYYSEGERSANLQRDIAKSLGEVGLQMPTTRAGFRALVEQQMALGDSGAEALAVLLRLESAFASITPAAEEAADSVGGIGQRIKDSLGVTADSLASLLKDSVMKARSATEASELASQGFQSQIYDGMFNAMTSSVSSILMDSVVRPLVDSLVMGSNVASLSMATGGMAAAGVMATGGAVAGSGVAAGGAMGGAASASGGSAAGTSMAAGGAAAAAAMAGGGAAAGSRVDDAIARARETMQIYMQVMKDPGIRDTISEISGSIGAVAGELWKTKGTFYQDTAFAGAAMGGAGSAAKSAESAFKSLGDALAAEVRRIRGLVAESNPIGGSFAYYQSQFAITTAQARSGDQDAAKALPELSRKMLELAATNLSTSAELRYLQATTAASLQATTEALAAKYGFKVPAFADGGVHAGGWAMVGERGPELAYMPPSRIYTADQTSALLGGGAGAAAGWEAVVRTLQRGFEGMDNRLREVERYARRADTQWSDWQRLGVPVVNKDDTKIKTEA